jgi:hypothetical protein
MASQIGAYKQALVAAADTTAGGVLTILNDSGEDRIITNLIVNTTTPSSGAASIDVGVASTVASNDTLIDGASVASAAACLDMVKNAGTNGAGARTWPNGYYITATASADATGLVGFAYVQYIVV